MTAGEKNSVQLILADAKDKPVTDLGNTLKVEVTTGSAEPLDLAMEPFFEVGEFGTPATTGPSSSPPPRPTSGPAPTTSSGSRCSTTAPT